MTAAVNSPAGFFRFKKNAVALIQLWIIAVPAGIPRLSRLTEIQAYVIFPASFVLIQAIDIFYADQPVGCFFMTS